MELTATEAWDRILERARPALPEQSFRTWLQPTKPLGLVQNKLTIGTRDEFAAEWLQDKYGDLLHVAAVQVLGQGARISFQYDQREAERVEDGRGAAAAPPRDSDIGDAMAGKPADGPEGTANSVALGSPLNDRYCFDRFVVGDNNEFAAASCRAVANMPARMYNPLFIYGGVGLGKTHLMQAIGNHVLATADDKRVAYLSSEQFTNDLITSIQSGRMTEFRRRYRQIDVLLIDDVHFLADKERTQEEFFHTFNAIYDARGQIVLTSDRPPKDIPGLEARLISRFEWGLVTDIKPPAFETRAAIIRKKADEDRIPLDSEVIEFVAMYCRSSVREIEGALIKLLAFSSLTKRDIDLELAREALSGLLRRRTGLSRSPEGMRARVAAEWKVSVDALISKRRTRAVTVPRQVAMYLIREVLNKPLNQIGHYFGGRDHSTVIHAVSKIERDMETDEELREKVNGLIAEFGDCG